MKKLIAVLLVAVFTLSHGVCADILTRAVIVSISSNNHLWYNVPVDLSAAMVNLQTGQKEIHMTVELPPGETAKFVRSSGHHVENYSFIPFASPDCIGCIILGCLVLIIGGIVIYILIQTCRHLLGNNQ